MNAVTRRLGIGDLSIHQGAHLSPDLLDTIATAGAARLEEILDSLTSNTDRRGISVVDLKKSDSTDPDIPLAQFNLTKKHLTGWGARSAFKRGRVLACNHGGEPTYGRGYVTGNRFVFVPAHADDHAILLNDSVQDNAHFLTAILGFRTQVAEARQETRRQRYLTRFFQRLATIDPLTKLPNREGLQQALKLILGSSRRDGQNVGFLYVDLNRFKPVNDTYGHAVGDQYLIEISNTLRQELRGDEVLARIGGDEFIIVVKGDNTSDMASAANRFARTLESSQYSITAKSGDGQVTATLNPSASFGIGILDPKVIQPQTEQLLQHPSVKEALQISDEGTYLAKSMSRETGNERKSFVGLYDSSTNIHYDMADPMLPQKISVKPKSVGYKPLSHLKAMYRDANELVDGVVYEKPGRGRQWAATAHLAGTTITLGEYLYSIPYRLIIKPFYHARNGVYALIHDRGHG